MAEVDLQEELPDQDRSARAVFEIRLQPGETLIWADRADTKRLASYYFWKPLLFASAMFVTVLLFFLLMTTDGFARIPSLGLIFFIVVGAMFMGAAMFIWSAITRQAWRGLEMNEHYYALTDRRLLRSIGGGRPRAYMREEISGLNVEGPQDEEALGDIQFYRHTGQEHQTYFLFHGIRRARKVAAVIKAHLSIGS